jgi:myosin heavy subunit
MNKLLSIPKYMTLLPETSSLALWIKQLAIRLSCKRPQLSRWLPRRERGQILIHAVLLLLAFSSIDSMAATEKEAKDRQAVHRLQLQLQAVQQEKTDLADQLEVLKKQVVDLESKRAELEKKLKGQSGKISELADLQKKTELTDKQQLAELSAKNQETDKELREAEQQLATTDKNLKQTQLEKEQEKKKSDKEMQVCEKKNSELYLFSAKLMEKYQAKGVMEAIRQVEPFTQLEKVKYENLVQEYRDKTDANRIVIKSASAQEVQRP